MSFDPTTNEAYIADGYYNHRVAVADIDTMKIKRYWGAYGNKPEDADMGNYNPDAPPLQQFRLPVHCAAFAATEKLVYVCDRRNNRIQVFSADGKFVKEKIIAQKTFGNGSVWEIAFSRDPQQKFMFVTDGANMKVWILDRASMEILTSFGTGGKQPGQFYAVHSIVLDSKSNIYTTETFDGTTVAAIPVQRDADNRKGQRSADCLAEVVNLDQLAEGCQIRSALQSGPVAFNAPGRLFSSHRAHLSPKLQANRRTRCF